MTSKASPHGRLGAVALAATALLLTQCGGDPANPPSASNKPSSGAQKPGTPQGSAGSGTALLTWLPPTQREDGSPLGDLSGYRIQYGMDPDWLDSSVYLGNPGLSSYLVEGLSGGRWYFTIRSIDSAGRESAPSEAASKTIG